MTIFKMAVAVDQHHGFKPFARSQRCKLQSFTHFDYAMFQVSQTNLTHSLKRAIEDANIHRSFSTPCLSLSTKVDEEFDSRPRIEIVGGCGAPRVRALVVEVSISMACGIDPLPVSSGLGGAYYLRSRNGDNIAVAKPIDEEPMAYNNPKGFVGRMLGQPGLKRSIRVGETAIRELAAYLLDYGEFSGVPATALVKFSHVAFHVNDTAPISAPTYKIASLQRFVDHDFDAGEFGPSSFSVGSVHRIGILDVRLLNLDRHAGNILVKKHEHENSAVGAAELVPIDHGLCLPEWLDDPYFEWLHWPQAALPFSDFEAEYIANLDPFKDAELLRTELPSLRESSIRVLVLCTIFLKRAVAAGLCLADIGEMMTREFCGGEEDLSVLEDVCAEAKASMIQIVDEDVDFLSSTEVDDDDDDDQSEGSEVEIGMFQFDDECDDDSKYVLDLPSLPQSPTELAKPLKIPRYSYSSLSGLSDSILYPLHEDDDQEKDSDDSNCNKDDCSFEDERGDKHNKVGVLPRSMSFSARNHNNEGGSISFEDMSEDEWKIFLDAFEKLLPEVFESTKNKSSKQRLGTSCEF